MRLGRDSGSGGVGRNGVYAKQPTTHEIQDILESCADTNAAEAPASPATPKPDSYSPEQTGTARTLSILLFAPDIEVLHLNGGIAICGLVKASGVLACHRPHNGDLCPR